MTAELTPLDTFAAMVTLAAEAEDLSQGSAFAAQAATLLEEAGELNGPDVYQQAVGTISALDWDADTARLAVLVADFAPGRYGAPRDPRDVMPLVATAMGQIDRLLKASPDGFAEDAAGRALQFISEVRGEVKSIRIIVASNGSFERQRSPLDTVGGLPSDLVVWDASDFVSQVTHSSVRDQTIDFTELTGGGIKYLGPVGGIPLQSFLLAIPGDVVADLYQAHGASILGRNIRAFLQVNNKVNRGIRKTASDSPEKFFAFNNGLSLTATGYSRALPGGIPVITALTGLEIVNGGQTTASLHHAKYHDGASLSGVTVQAKLTILRPDDVNSDDLALQIAHFANSQSPVRMGDLSSNSDFFRAIERLSRQVDFGGELGGQRQWYFERIRGQFATDLAAAKSLGNEARFKARFDTSRRFDKADLAKYELAWLQFPFVVAAGAERSLASFTNLENGPAKGGVPDEEYFRRVVAKATLWRAADKVIGALALGGYKAQDVAYVVALISNRVAGRLDLNKVANLQDAGDDWRHAVSELAPIVHRNLIESAGARNVSSWAKTAAAWQAVLSIDWTPPESLRSSAPRRDETRTAVAQSQVGLDLAADPAEREARDRVVEYGSSAWFQLSSWAKDTDNLQSWQRGIAFSIGRAISSSKTPTAKQVTQAIKILDEAERLGFRADRG
ncbi:AIPR family protein [Microbacterium sp. P5_E9]